MLIAKDRAVVNMNGSNSDDIEMRINDTTFKLVPYGTDCSVAEI